MDCLLCEKSYPETQLICPTCDNNLQRVKPYSPHLSQLIKLGEGVCTGNIPPQKLEIAIKTMLKKLDKAEDTFFEEESAYSEEDKLVMDDILNNILEHADFLRKSIEELQGFARNMNARGIYTTLDKAKIAETMLLKASQKLGNLTDEMFEAMAKEKGIELKK